MNAPEHTTIIATLAADWLTLKRLEDEAKVKRIEVEALICAELRDGGDEGTTTAKLDTLKVTVTRKMNRSVDTSALQAAWTTLPAFAQAAFTWKADISLPLLRKLQNDHPGLYADAARFITTKPAKASVKVEVI